MRSGMLAALMLLGAGAGLAQKVNIPSPHETVTIGSEGELPNLIDLPPEIRHELESDPFVQETMRSATPALTALPIEWTECSVVHLSTSDELDYVIRGRGDLMGAHATHFWVYRKTPEGMKQVLFAFADGLIIHKSRWKGFLTIETVNFSAIQMWGALYRFDGTQYKVAKKTQEKLK